MGIVYMGTPHGGARMLCFVNFDICLTKFLLYLLQTKILLLPCLNTNHLINFLPFAVRGMLPLVRDRLEPMNLD